MRKVLVFRSKLLRYSETFIREQALSLARWHPVLVGEERAERGLDLDSLDHILLKSRSASLLGRLLWAFARFFRMPPPGSVSRLRAENADLVHVHFGLDAVRFAPILKRLNLPIVVTLHGYDINRRREWWEFAKGSRKNRRYPERLLALANRPDVRFIAVSPAIAEAAVQFGIPPAKIAVSHIGIAANRFRPAEKPIAQRQHRVLFVGRLVENKGCTYLLRAFVAVQRSIPDAELVVIGEGRLRAKLETQARRTGIRATFLGAQSSEQVKAQMNQTRVVCLPSVTLASGDSEGFGMVLLEAQACGVPVVTSSKGGADALVDGKTGFYHQERDVDAIAKAIVTLLSDDALAQRFSVAARQFVTDHFDIGDCSAKLERLYDEAIGTTVR